MKNYSQFKPLVVAAFATVSCLPVALHAQGFELQPAAVTIAWTVKETAPGTFVRNQLGGAFVIEDRKRIPSYGVEDFEYIGWLLGSINAPSSYNGEFVAKIQSTRVGNREFLQELAREDLLPGVDKENPNVTGWGIFLVQPDAGDPDPVTPFLAARKIARGGVIEESVRLDQDQIVTLNYKGGAYSYNEKYREAYRYSQGVLDADKTVVTLSATYAYEDIISLRIAIPNQEVVVLHGVHNYAGRYQSFYPEPTEKDFIDYISVPGAQRITSLSGSTEFEFDFPELGEGQQPGDDDFEFPEPGPSITGSVTIAATRATPLRL